MRLIGVIALSVSLMAAGSATSATNLIQNGDFSQGDVGFSTAYTYIVNPSSTALELEGTITVTDNPFSVHPYWVNLGATGNPMLVVNGATSGNPTIWEEDNITTSVAGAYEFHAEVMDICCNASFGDNPNAPSQIQFQINVNGGGWQNLAEYTTQPASPAPGGDAGISVPISGSFISTAGGEFSIRATNGDTAAGGNDFALDNISVAIPEPATWAMMLVGFGALGAGIRSRHRSNATA